MRILIIMTMRGEAKPIIKELNLERTAPYDDFLPMEIYRGSYLDNEILLAVSGKDPVKNVNYIGTQPAAVSTLMGIKSFRPDCIMNAGTAGGYKDKGAEIGDVYVVDTAFYHDRRIPLPDYEEYSAGRYKCTNPVEISQKLGLKTSDLSTGNSLDLQPCDADIIAANGAVLKDMEGAAVVWLANTYGIPVYLLKSVTDFVDYPENNFEDFKRNLHLASDNIRIEMIELIKLLSSF